MYHAKSTAAAIVAHGLHDVSSPVAGSTNTIAATGLIRPHPWPGDSCVRLAAGVEGAAAAALAGHVVTRPAACALGSCGSWPSARTCEKSE